MAIDFFSDKHRTRMKVTWMLSLVCAVVLTVFVPVTRSENPPKPSASADRTTISLDGSAETVRRVCSNVYNGNFAAARELLAERRGAENHAVTELADIVSEYEAIEQGRRLARTEGYQEKLVELNEFKFGSNPSDVNEPNNISKAFSVIAKVREFANEQQKEELLSGALLQQTIEKARADAAKLEAEGKWLDAYIRCYSWLQAIDKDNKEYADYADQLLDKANIVASFQDSPCETRTERFERVDAEMFKRAIDALNFNYVSIIDYREMATKAIKRCKLLAEVLNSSQAVRKALGEENTKYDTSLPAWSAALAGLQDEIDQSVTGISKDKFKNVFKKVLDFNKATVQMPEKVLIAQFAEAALSALDPYTVMVWPKQVKDFEKTMTNEFTGIGIEISKQKGMLTVASLLPDTPAYCSGLDAGDVIEKVDGEETKDMSLTCAVKRITGPAGTVVTLTVKTPGQEETRDIAITRAKITVPTIRGWQRTEAGEWLYMIDEKSRIGYVRVTSFSPSSATDLENVLNELEAEGLQGLILDLRFNSGGLLDVAIAITDAFVAQGPIVSTRPRFGVWTYASAKKKNTHPNYPLVILINSGSASASEIVSGALQDPKHKRAILIGERTHGKGSVQGITAYPGGNAQLKYTMAHYYLPSNQRVESRNAMEKQDRKDWGIGPDIKIKLRSDELKKMVDVQRDNDVLVRAGHDNGATPLKKHLAEDTLAADPQLAVGVLVVKSKLIEEQTKNERFEAAKLN